MMKFLIKSASLEVATNACFLQNAAYIPQQLWKKQMLTVLVTALCVSCGNSGGPSGSESTSNSLLNSESIAAVSTSDTVVGPGFSGFGVAEAQAPGSSAVPFGSTESAESAQPLLLAAAETELPAPGKPVSSALQQLGIVVAGSESADQQTTPVVPETAVVPESEDASVEVADVLDTNDAAEPELSPEAKIELAALEAELAELAELEPEDTNPVDETDSNDTGKPEMTGTVSYDSIEANGLGNGTYPTDDYYLAEFLYQNPDTCFWEQDTKNRTITAVKTPTPPEDSVYMPSPSGGDDTEMLEKFFKKNAGKSVVGKGGNEPYRVKTLDIKDKIDIYELAMEPAPGAKQMVRVTAPDVRIFNSSINGKNLESLAIGFNIEDGAHRFVLVNSGVKDIFHKRGANASAIFIRGADDYQIVCNRVENILNSTSDKSKTARANFAWKAGRNEHNMTGGLIANNYASNFQSNGKRVDAEFFTMQNYNSVSAENPVRIFANRAYNTGKRFTKNQEGSTLILSNYIEWNTKKGPLGTRRLIAPFVVQRSDNVIIRNNRVSISAEGHFDAVFKTDASTGSHTSSSGGNTQNNIHFDNNDIEIKDNRDPNAKSGPILMRAMASHVDVKATGHEAKNSSANNNNVHGTGSLQNYYVFQNGYSNDGGRFEHKNNVFSIPFYKSAYR